MDGAPPEKLDKESLDRVLDYVRQELESGCGSPVDSPSLLGLWTMAGNWVNMPHDLFALHIGLNDEKTTRQSGIPAEFVHVGLNVLDAYATCVLAADVFIPHANEITLSISLDVGEAVLPSIREASDLWITMSVFSGGEPCIATSDSHLELLRSLSIAVETKEMRRGFWSKPWRPGLVFLTDLRGCVMRMPYPGKMLAEKTPYLLQHAAEEWPRATLRFLVADELRRRARKVIDFLLNDPTTSACA